MRKLFFVPILALSLICSCGKIDPSVPDVPGTPATEPLVSLSFGAETTKSFFDPTATAETWEKSLSSIDVLVFSADGNLIVQRKFNASELSAKTATFAVPNTTAGTSCEFYAVANRPVTGVSTKAELLALVESDPGEYNSTFAQVSTSAKRAGGFIMTGSATKSIAAAGTRTDVALTLKRTAAKIAVQTALSAEFANRYLGKVRVNSAVLSRAASRGNVISQGSANTGAMSYTFTQQTTDASGKFNNLFYTFENGSLAAGSRLLLTLNATYDRDGNFATTADQVPVTYAIELTGGGAGQFVRNGYYRVQVTIDGLTGAEASATITVADWESPVTQTINIGA